ncbi:MAG: ATPase, partial [Gammaproteobacteria bacterium]
FMAFLRSLDQLPDIDAILRGEEKSVPEGIDLQYAVASALVGRTRKIEEEKQTEAFGAILEYATLFPQREMGVMLVTDLYRTVGSDLFAVPQFTRWAQAVGDLVLYEG